MRTLSHISVWLTFWRFGCAGPGFLEEKIGSAACLRFRSVEATTLLAKLRQQL